MGIDAVVRVPGADVTVPLQVKSRHVLSDGKMHLLIRDHELRDPRSVIIAVLLDTASVRLHDTALCVDVATFRKLSFRRHGVESGYQASIPFPPSSRTRWRQCAVQLGQLASRLFPAFAEELLVPFAPVRQAASAVGRRGEARLLDLVTGDSRLNVFKAFPDLELAEYVMRHDTTNRTLAIQVKSVSVDGEHPRGTVKVPAGTFRATPLTYFVCLAENRRDASLIPECLLIPSMDVADLASRRSSGDLRFEWRPGSTRSSSSIGPYRCETSKLAARIAALLE